MGHVSSSAQRGNGDRHGLNDGEMQNGRPRRIDRLMQPKLGFACVRHRSGKF